MQDLFVGLIVTGCAAYAVWALMPVTWRRAAAGRALGLPLPHALRSRLQRLTLRSAGCGCDGCDAPAAKTPGEAQPVRFIRKTNT